MGIARPSNRSVPVPFGEMDGGTMNPARSNVEAPESRAVIESEHSRARNGQVAAARHLAHNGNQSRLEIHGEQVMGGYTDDGLSRRCRDGVNHRFAGNTLAEVLENRFLETPFLNPVFRKIQVRYGHGSAAVRSIHESDRAGRAATNGF